MGLRILCRSIRLRFRGRLPTLQQPQRRRRCWYVARESGLGGRRVWDDGSYSHLHSSGLVAACRSYSHRHGVEDASLFAQDISQHCLKGHMWKLSPTLLMRVYLGHDEKNLAYALIPFM